MVIVSEVLLEEIKFGSLAIVPCSIGHALWHTVLPAQHNVSYRQHHGMQQTIQAKDLTQTQEAAYRVDMLGVHHAQTSTDHKHVRSGTSVTQRECRALVRFHEVIVSHTTRMAFALLESS